MTLLTPIQECRKFQSKNDSLFTSHYKHVAVRTVAFSREAGMSEGTTSQNSLWSCIWIFTAKTFADLYLDIFSFAKFPGLENISLHLLISDFKKALALLQKANAQLKKKEKNYLIEDLASLISLHFYGIRTFSHKYKGMSCYIWWGITSVEKAIYGMFAPDFRQVTVVSGARY